jgi:Holliday junction resolvase-like predicted endonuclease
VRFTVNGRQIELTGEDVRHELQAVRPEPVHQYAIQIGSTLYPVKQALEVVSRVPRSEFTTQAARRVLAAVGFDVFADSGRLPAAEVSRRDVSDIAAPATAMTPGDGDWHTEARVQAMLIGHLRREGWEIVRSADTARRERGIDIEATRGTETVAIEVKGFPGRNYADPGRAGEKKRTQPSTQAKIWYASAILASMIVRTQKPSVRVVMAFPDFPRYRDLYRHTAEQLQKCEIELWWVTREGNVTAADF